MVHFSISLLALFASLSGISLIVFKKQINFFGMKFFRDLGRYKARKRLYGNKASLMPLLMGKEEKVMEKVEEMIELQDKSGEVFTMTAAELAEMDGRTETTPIYIAIKGHIYDISLGREAYGPGKAYSNLVGKDSTRAFANGCTEDACLGSSMEGLNEMQLTEIDKWHDFYHNHDKYKYVGRLAIDPVDAVIEKELNKDNNQQECNSTECLKEIQ